MINILKNITPIFFVAVLSSCATQDIDIETTTPEQESPTQPTEIKENPVNCEYIKGSPDSWLIKTDTCLLEL